MSRRHLAVAAVLAAAPAAARADVDVDGLGPARAISHSSSASRDTAAPGLVIAPHRVMTGGVDAAVVSLRTPAVTVRFGFFGMLELESEGETRSVAPFPDADIRFWRGLYGYSVAVSLDRLARAWCDGCALEATVGARHESEHYTGSNDGGAGTDYADRPIVGDLLMVDVAARYQRGALALTARLQGKWMLPRRSSYAGAPGADVELRWRRWPRVHPFTAAFAEYAWGTLGYPDAYTVRDLAGVALPSARGDLYLYGFAEVGHRKGLAAYTEERVLGAGIRLAFW